MTTLLGAIDEFNTMIPYGSTWPNVQERDSPGAPRAEKSVDHTQPINLNEEKEERGISSVDVLLVDRHLSNSQMTQVTMAKTKAGVEGHRMLVNHSCSFPPAGVSTDR